VKRIAPHAYFLKIDIRRDARWLLRPTAPYWRIIMIAAMIATITATMMTTIIMGLLIMCRSIPNLVPSGSKSMPHFGHFPGFG
jgi:hypothetical protein